MVDVPAPVSRDHEFLHAVCGLLAEQNTLLGDIRDRLTAPEPPPAPTAEPTRGPVAVQLREPEPPSPLAVTEPESTPTKTSTRTARTGRRSTKAGN